MPARGCRLAASERSGCGSGGGDEGAAACETAAEAVWAAAEGGASRLALAQECYQRLLRVQYLLAKHAAQPRCV